MSVSVRLSQSRISLPPGGTQTVTVSVANTSTIVEHYTVEAVRLPIGMTARASGVPLQLSVGEQADVVLTLTAATSPPPVAGATMVGVMVSSPHRRQVRRVEELIVEVEPLPALAAALEPTSVSGRTRGEFEIVLRNGGNAALDVDLVGRDPQRRLRVTLGASKVSLAPGATARVTAVVAGRPVVMGRAGRHQVAFTAQPVARAQVTPAPPGLPSVVPSAVAAVLPPWAGQAEFLQQPVLPPGLIRALGAAFGVATIAGVMAIGAMAVRGAITGAGKDKPTTTAAAPPSGGGNGQPSQPPASQSGGASPTGGAASSAPPPPSSAPGTPSASAPTQAPAPTSVVDFTVPPPGGSAGSHVIAANAYPGVTMAAPASADCAISGSNLLWLDAAGLRYVAPGHGDPADATRVVCQDGVLQFAAPAPSPALSVRLVGVAAPGTTAKVLSYRVTVHDALGGATSKDVIVAPGASQVARLADSSGQGLVDITVTPSVSGSGTLVAVTSFGVG